ncbi:tetratricopeptide repeat protein, partial [Dehalococcoidia bacterium]|nr:tetratricopeptide repeat protein [Dehalococcoidia bacterium]
MNTDQWINRGEALLSQRNYVEAEAAFNLASSLDPSNSEVWYKLGNTRFWQSKYGEAELAYLECVRFDPLNLKAWYNLGVSLGEQDRWVDAENIYLKAADLVPNTTETWHSDIWTNLGAALNAQERYREAKPIIQKAISINSESVEGWYNLGNNHLRQGDWAKAGKAYETAIGVSTTFQKAWKGLAITQHERGDYQAAEQTYLEALRLDPVDKQSWFNLSVAQLNLAKLDEAEESCLSSIAIEPQETDSWCNLGLIQSRTGNLNEAESAYRKALELDPQDATAWVNLGVSLRNQDRSSEAEYAYSQAVVFSPTDANAWRNLGNTLLDLDKFSEAETAARRVISLKPNNFLQHRAWSTLATAKANQSKNPVDVIYAYRRMASSIESFRLEESKWETRLEEFQTPAKALQHAAHYALKTDPRFSEQSLTFTIQSKARTLGELLNHEPGQIRSFLSAKERRIFDDLEQARESLESARHGWNSVPQLQYPSVSGQTSKRLQPFQSPEQEQEWRQTRESLGVKYDSFFHQLAVDHPELEPFMLGPRPHNFRFNLARLKRRLQQEEAVLELLLVDDKTFISFLVTKDGLISANSWDGDDRLDNDQTTTLEQWLEEISATLITSQNKRAGQIGITLTDELLHKWGAI